jgi:hypothetical protein
MLMWRRRNLVAGNTVAALLSIFGGSVGVAPPAAADPAPEAVQAVTAARSGAACGPLEYNPIAEHAAEIVNQSTLTYLDHTGENVPLDDQHPIALMKDLGVDTTTVMSLQGAGPNEADAIKGVLLEGYKAIPDCSYTEVGASRLYEDRSGQFLVVVILVGS